MAFGILQNLNKNNMSGRRKFGTLQKEMELVTEELKKSGTWTPPAGCKKVDAFLVGGGGGGSVWNVYNKVNPDEEGNYSDANGGGGGYTKTYYDIPVNTGEAISFTIGNGGAGAYGSYQSTAEEGGKTWFKDSNTYYANGGKPGKTPIDGSYSSYGGDGGSGGGCSGGKGGTNGGNGATKRAGTTAGKGQGYSTKCPFDGYSTRVFSGGGGSAGNGYANGGDSSAGDSYSSNGNSWGTSGKANTGGGGGGKWSGDTSQAGSGGSGIIILRYYKYKE